jgi:hypothetical protein
MELKQKQVLDDMSVILKAVIENSNLVDYSTEEHLTGGYVANIANIGFGTLRAPDGNVSIFPPNALHSLEDKIRATVMKSVEKKYRTFDEISAELEKALQTLPQNEHEEMLAPMYQKGVKAVTHSIISELVIGKQVEEKNIKKEKGLYVAYKMKK